MGIKVKAKLLPELVPEGAWGSNLRSELPDGEWDRLRKDAYRKAGNRCEVCGGRGPKWPVECHEVWDYDERKGVQRLAGLVALCPDCHEVKHIGLAEMNGRLDAAKRHMRRVNGFGAAEADKAVADAFDDWERRNGTEWKLDLSALKGARAPKATGASLKQRWKKIGRER